METGARNQRIAVCHVASGDLWAGAEAQLAALLRALAHHRDLRVFVVLLNEGRLAEEARRSGADVKVIPESAHTFFEILGEATRYVRARGILILHSHRYKENLLAALLARRCHVPFVIRTEHGAPEQFKGLKQLKQRVLRQVDRLVGSYATDRVISVSAELQPRLARYVNPRRIAVIPNGLDTDNVHSHLSPLEAKRRLNIPADCPVLGYAGRLVPIKRLDIFLAAAKEMASRTPEARFVVVGEGCDRPRLEERAQALGLEHRAFFLGHRDDIFDVLRALDVFVLCSDHEGLPMVLLEALHMGVAVVARQVGGIPEVIQDGVSGSLVRSADPRALADACVRLLEDSNLRRRLAQGGQSRVAERFLAERTAADVAELYLRCVRPSSAEHRDG
ncbi:MAG TPA: glycosyltransferase [Terriglobia bacterium]|nr:glycosyltransferase [Terriglobia bacterium]